MMKEQHISRLETQVERLVEGAFAAFFGKKIRAQDIALQVARAMEDGCELRPGDPRLVAPDHYTIHVHPEIQRHLLNRQPALAQILSQHLIELATDSGYRLNNTPVIDLLGNPALEAGELEVEAAHVSSRSATALMKRVEVRPTHETPRNPQLLVGNGKQVIALNETIVNIGRSRDNHVILDDNYVSRHHAQLRLRFGRYTLFDTQSQGGTFVNDVQVREHPLQSGDVIRLGRTQMVYIEDDPLSDSQTGPIPRFDADSPEQDDH